MHRSTIIQLDPLREQPKNAHRKRRRKAALSSLQKFTFVRSRLYRLGVIAATATAIYYPIWALANEIQRRGALVIAQVLAVFGASLVLDVALIFLAKSRSISERPLHVLVSTYLVLRCALLSLDPVLLDGALGMPPPRMAFTCVAVVLFPMLIPSAPARLALPITLALATQPLAVWVFGPSPAQSDVLINSALTAALAGALSYAAARVAWGLRVTAARARQVGAYELVSPIGHGAMGEVWLGRHRLLARPAAIKLMPYDSHEPGYAEAVRHFEREAQVTASLTSPHTVRLFDYGITHLGSVYYVMELCEGRDLQALVDAQGPLTPTQTIDVALQICDSLGEAHQLGLVHRDLKPANVMMCQAGRRNDFVKVLDFGLAELVRRLAGKSSSADSSVARLAGTPAYMAPELALGHALDPRSDLYQLGCVMFFLLTGRLVFDASSPIGVALSHAHTPAPLVGDVAEQAIPPALEALVARLLAKKPDDRFADAEELELALHTALIEPDTDRRQVRHPDALTKH